MVEHSKSWSFGNITGKLFKTYMNYQAAVKNPNDPMAQFADKLRKYEEEAQGLGLPGKYAGFVAGAEDAFVKAVKANPDTALDFLKKFNVPDDMRQDFTAGFKSAALEK